MFDFVYRVMYYISLVLRRLSASSERKNAGYEAGLQILMPSN